MSQVTETREKRFEKALEPEEDTGGHEERAANLFDIRRIIGGLFVLYGVILVVMGLGASEADKRRADGINVNLSVGIALLVIAALFIAWALWRPLGRELQEADQE
jgi:protein-S-isoprenylcysteine O-methyltransferase Ste14